MWIFSLKFLWFSRVTWIDGRQCDVFCCSSDVKTRYGYDYETQKYWMTKFSMEGFDRPLLVRNWQYLHVKSFPVVTLYTQRRSNIFQQFNYNAHHTKYMSSYLPGKNAKGTPTQETSNSFSRCSTTSSPASKTDGMTAVSCNNLPLSISSARRTSSSVNVRLRVSSGSFAYPSDSLMALDVCDILHEHIGLKWHGTTYWALPITVSTASKSKDRLGNSRTLSTINLGSLDFFIEFFIRLLISCTTRDFQSAKKQKKFIPAH